MCAVWQPQAFSFDDFEGWEDWATEDGRLGEPISSGIFVPINVGGGGVFQIIVRWGAGAGLTEPERQCLVASSDPYLFISRGCLALGGLEDCGNVESGSSSFVEVADGRYSVRIDLIDWKADPRSLDSSGRPTKNALPDFVVSLGPGSSGSYRTTVNTFERK